MLVTSRDVLSKAERGRYAVGAFNVNNLETIHAVLEAALKLKSPVILQTSEGAIEYAGMAALAGAIHGMVRYDKRYQRVPVVVHLDHGKNLSLIETAIRSGWYTSVMYDGSALSVSENIKNTKKVVVWAHKYGVSVEAELGVLSGQEDRVQARASHYTDPSAALEFVRKTGCDALGVSIGTAHGAFKSKGIVKLDFRRLTAIHKIVKAPLVLHGASGIPKNLITKLHEHCSVLGDCVRLANAHGVSDTFIRRAIKLGVRKINIDTELRVAFTAAVREQFLMSPTGFDPRALLGPARALMQEVVEHKIKLFGSLNKA